MVLGVFAVFRVLGYWGVFREFSGFRVLGVLGLEGLRGVLEIAGHDGTKTRPGTKLWNSAALTPTRLHLTPERLIFEGFWAQKALFYKVFGAIWMPRTILKP